MSAAMAAQAELKDFVPDSERALAQEIAKAMQPPLMSRLARIQSSFGLAEPDHEGHAAPAAEMPPAIPAPQLPVGAQPATPIAAPLPPSPALMDLIADDPDAGFSTPPSVEWLGKARRERNRARMRNALAWLATLAIGGAIVAGTMLMLARERRADLKAGNPCRGRAPGARASDLCRQAVSPSTRCACPRPAMCASAS